MANYHKTDWSCGDNSKQGLANLLSASVHAAYAVNSASEFTGDAKRTYDTIVSLTQGGTGHELSHSQAYAMLSVLAVTDPTALTCEAIYSGVVAVEDGSGESDESVNQIDPTIKCTSDGTPADGTGLTAANAGALYTHCVHQNTYGFSYPTSGTFAIPKQGVEPKPMILPLFEVNSTTSPYKRAQILVGTRWGYSTIAYIFLMLSSAFLLMDCMVLLLAELTRVDAYFAQNALTQGSGKTMKEGMMTVKFPPPHFRSSPRCTHTCALSQRLGLSYVAVADASHIRGKKILPVHDRPHSHPDRNRSLGSAHWIAVGLWHQLWQAHLQRHKVVLALRSRLG